MSRTYYQKFLGALMCKISVGDSNRQLGGETLLIPRAHEIEWHPRPQRQDSWGPRESGKHRQAVEPSAPPTVLCVMIYQCLSSVGLSDFTFTFHFRALEKEMATHSSVLAWRIPGTREPGGLPSMGSHRVGHDWSYLAAAVQFSSVDQ